MRTVSRLVLAIVVAFAVSLYYNLFLGSRVRTLFPAGFKDIAGTAVWLLLIVGTGWLVWHITRPIDDEVGSPARHVVIGAVLIGGVGFVAGFAGPLIIGWGGNLGPLLGILVTGPGGVVVGAVLGYVHWIRVRRGPQVDDKN